MLVITLYTEIFPGDAERVLAQLRADPTAAVEVRINSPGGSVAEGLAIYNALKPRKPTVFVDGVAASIASMIAMAGQSIIAAENALIMIHDPWVGTEGNSTELRKAADQLDKYRDAMLRAYARAGIAEPELIDMLTAETWLTADEALALGFVDEIAEPLRFAAHAADCFAAYHHTPEELLMPQSSNTNSSAAAAVHQATTNATQTPPAPGGSASNPDAQTANAAVLGALKQRNTEILAIAQPFMHRNGVQAFTIESIADPATTVNAYRAHMLDLIGRDAAPCGSAVPNHSDGSGTNDFVAAASDALLIRAGIRVDKPHPGVRDVQGMSVHEIVRVCASRSGNVVDTARGGRDMIRAAMSTSDFPGILANTLGKALRTGFEVEPRTFDAWTRQVTVRDFKPQSRDILGSAPDLLPVPEGAEYHFGSMDEDKALAYSVGKYGRLVQLTWEAMINDDLGAFLRIVQAMGQAAARAEGDQVYSSFTENSGAGPVMQDGVNLFNSGHANLATSSAALDADALSSARVLLRRQKAVGGGVMNLVPRFLLVAPEQEQAAETLIAAAARALSQGSNNTLVAAWLADLQLIVEARLTASAAYLLTAPTSVDTYERAWLEADNGPVITEEDGFSVDARTYKARHVFGGRWLDWRGAVKVPLSA